MRLGFVSFCTPYPPTFTRLRSASHLNARMPSSAVAPDRPARPRDLTRGAIAPTLFAFALPILGGNVMQSLNGSVNAVWIGRFLGEEALAAIANANNILFFLLGAVFGIGMAATILVAQAIRKLGSECIFSIAIEPIQAQHATAKWIHGQSSSVPSAPTSREIRPRVLASPVRPNGLLRCAFPSSGLRRR